MKDVFDVIIMPFAWLFRIGYILTDSYILAILFFAVVVKIITFPLMLKAQKNSIQLLRIQPKINYIRKQFAGDSERINEETYLLYKKEKYSPLSGLLPLFIQLALLICTVSVIRDTDKALSGLFYSPMWLGIDLSIIPSTVYGAAILATLSGASSYALCLAQNRLNPAQRVQKFWGKWGFSLFLIAFSVYFPIVMPGGIGLYWFYSNALGVIAALVANAIYNPKNYVSAELLLPPPKISKEEKQIRKAEQKRLRDYENESVKRWKSESLHELVFYAISGGTYKYYSEIINYVLENSDIVIHYITNDPNDKLLQNLNPKLKAYYIGHKRIITFMLNLDAKICATTVMGLQKFQIKRSVSNTEIEYIYIFHRPSSTHLVCKKGSFDYYDTILCVGRHHIDELRRSEQIYNLPQKKLVKCGYGVVDQLTRLYKNLPKRNTEETHILIAPSWSVDNILDSCLDEIVRLLSVKYKLHIRPHPEYVKRFGEKWNDILRRYINANNVVIDDDFSSQDTIYSSDIVITDWSNAAFEFSYTTKRPSIFINTPMKVMNDEWELLGIEPIDFILREQLGAEVELSAIDSLPGIVEDMLSEPEKYYELVNNAIDTYLYYPGRSGEAGGKYIISQLRN